MNNSVFGRDMKNIIKHLEIELITKRERNNYLVLEPNHDKAKLILSLN